MAAQVQQTIAMVLEQLLTNQTNDDICIRRNRHGDQ